MNLFVIQKDLKYESFNNAHDLVILVHITIIVKA